MKTLEENHVNTYLDSIQDETLKSFTREALMLYGDEEKFHEAEKVINVFEAMFTKMKQMNEQSRPVWVDVLRVAAYIHNLFYDGSLLSVFEARETLMPLAVKHGVPINGCAMIFQAVEGQLGEDMPVEACQVKGDSPNRLFAWAVWFVEEYNGAKVMPECRALQ